MLALGEVLLWCRALAINDEGHSKEIIFVLTDMSHNWPAVVTGKDTWHRPHHIVSGIEAAVEHEFNEPIWQMEIRPKLVKLVEVFASWVNSGVG
jgi:hypothetical protein